MAKVFGKRRKHWVCIGKLKRVNKLATEIGDEVDGSLVGDGPERTIFKKARKIAALSNQE